MKRALSLVLAGFLGGFVAWIAAGWVGGEDPDALGRGPHRGSGQALAPSRADGELGGGEPDLEIRGDEPGDGFLTEAEARQVDTTDAPEEPQANPLTWEWERVEARLFRSMRAEPDPDADRRFVRSMMDWPEELNAENSAEHLGGVTLSEEQAAHLERSVRTLNAELESHAWIYADSLNRIRRANYDAGDYAATPVEPGAPWPKVPWNRSSGKYPGWLVTWPAITFEDHPELRSAQDLKGRTVSHTRRHLTDTEVPHTSPPLQRISVSGDLRSFNCSRARVQPRCAAATPGLVDSRQIRGGEPSETQHHPLARSPLDQAPPCSPARLSVADGGGRQVASLR